MNAYEEYKTIIMAKSNTATAVRADIYVCIKYDKCDSGSVGREVGLKLQGC